MPESLLLQVSLDREKVSLRTQKSDCMCLSYLREHEAKQMKTTPGTSQCVLSDNSQQSSGILLGSQPCRGGEYGEK